MGWADPFRQHSKPFGGLAYGVSDRTPRLPRFGDVSIRNKILRRIYMPLNTLNLCGADRLYARGQPAPHVCGLVCTNLKEANRNVRQPVCGELLLNLSL